MKEFVKKLIGRLEGRKKYYHKCALNEVMENGHTLDAEGFLGKEDAYNDTISIVNQLAEEICVYKTENITWIPCSERLPEKGGAYLVCSEKQSVYVAHFYKNSVVPHWSKGNIIYWQPLPEPYQKGD